MIEVYRSGTDHTDFDRYVEICRDCAAEEIAGGYYVEHDEFRSMETGPDDWCQKCEGDFLVDGRRRENKQPLEMP